MALTSIKNRLKKVQDSLGAADSFHMVAELIARGAYYDELTDEEKAAYVRYKESLGGVADDIAGAELEKMLMDKPEKEAYHFPLTRRRKPPTPEEHAQRVREVEAYMQEITDEYNSPEARAKREAEYQEMHRIGALRKAAYDRGEPMDKYPLPWEKKGAEA